MTRLRPAAALALIALTLSLSGCVAPRPAPTPTPTGFATEAEAFEAAEATYRAYLDASNSLDLADPTTFEAVFAWTVGPANAEEREVLSTMHGDRWTRVGASHVQRAEPLEADGTTQQTVKLTICLDVSEVDYFDANGDSQVKSGRKDVQQLDVTFAAATTSTGLAVSDSFVSSGADICGA